LKRWTRSIFNNARAGSAPANSLPQWIRFSDQVVWPNFLSSSAMIGRIKNAGGRAEMLAPPERGIRGNSHMIRQDKNSHQIADLILQWIDTRVSRRSEKK